MPTATSFAALGRGNGFPSCASKIDVSQYAHWVTLGGVSSGGASESQINQSLVNAMKLWWNLYSSKGSFSASSTSSADGTNSVSESNREVILKRFISSPSIPNPIIEADPLVPLRRACFGTVRSGLGPFALFSSFKESDDEYSSGSADGFIQCGSSSFIVRMYNGSTDNEDNFVGYGVSGVASAQGEANVTPVQTIVDIFVVSFTNATDFGPRRDPTQSNSLEQQSVFQTNLGGMPFKSVTFCQAGSSTNPESESVSVNELSGTASASFSSEVSDQSGSASSSASISTIDFYTY